MSRLQGKVVIVTGAGSGIGRATLEAFAAAGARVHGVDVHGGRIQALAETLQGQGRQVTAHVVDCRDAEAVQTLVDGVMAREGRIDVLHNNAGVGHGAHVHETTLDDWRWVIETNLWSVIYGVQAVVPHMIRQGSGHIVNTASMAGLIGLPRMAPYCTSKFAVVGLSESLAAELAPHGIRVTAVCPGLINTAIVKDGRIGAAGEERQGIEGIWQRYGASPERVAQDVLRAVRQPRSLQLSAPTVLPLWLLKRLSTDLYQRAIRLVAPVLPGGSS